MRQIINMPIRTNEEEGTRLALLEQDMDSIKQVVMEIRDSTRAISQYMEKLTTLEERHAEHDARLEKIEQEMPELRMVRRWIMGGVTGMLAIFGMAMMKLAGWA